MLRVYFQQHWFNLSDPGVDDALYGFRSVRCFVSIGMSRELVSSSLLPASERQAASNSAIDSTCAVCGNMSMTPAASNR
jgi:IS5 family transposase